MKQTLRGLLLFALCMASVAFAQPFPFPFEPLSDEAPYYHVRYDASDKPGELIFAVNFTVWIPPDVSQLRGVIVHQHGCGRGAAYTGLTGAFDLHWQALAKKHDSALVSAAYEQPSEQECRNWAEPRNGSAAVFLKALTDLSAKSGHTELSSVPWALWGHSGGAYWVGAMALLHPERTAAVWMRSGAMAVKTDSEQSSEQAFTLTPERLAIPMMLNQGAKEGISETDNRFARIWTRNKSIFQTIRSKGGLIAHSLDIPTLHHNGNQRYLAIPWFNAILEARLPKNAGQPLHNMPAEDAWLAPLLGTKALPAAHYQDDKNQAVWLPNQHIAKAWMSYMQDNSVADHTPPPAPTNLVINDSKLTWNAEADLESGLAYFIIQRDGVFLANVVDKEIEMNGRSTFQRLYNSDSPRPSLPEMSFIDKTSIKGKKYKYRVIAVNTVGLKSH